MVVDEIWDQFFKPEVRKQGLLCHQKGAVFLQIKADTQIQAFIKGSSRIKVHFVAKSISSPSFDADCTCSASAKERLCQHIWATLLTVQKEFPDFLDSKNEVNKITQMKAANPAQVSAKAKQADYRKQQYQKQKQKLKELKRGDVAKPELPEDVKNAVQFFSENGFTFATPVDHSEITNARKILARVFHPDKGGTHAEALTLNKNYETLMAWFT